MKSFKFPLEISENEEVFTTLSFPEDGPNSVVVPGYDIEAELAALSLGFPSVVGQFAADWQTGAAWFFTDQARLETFIGMLNDDGDALYEVFDKKNLSRVFNDALRLIAGDVGDMNPDDFFSVVEDLSFENVDFDDLDWDQDLIKVVGEQAFNTDDFELIRLLEPLYTAGEFFELTDDSPDCEEINETKVKCSVEFNFYFLDEHKHQWTTRVVGRYTDAELTSWEFEEDYDSQEGSSDAELILQDSDEDTDWVSRVEEEVNCYQPEVPEPDYSGEYAVFINGNFHGRYEDHDSAQRFVSMSEEVIEREGLSDDVALYRIIEGREEEAEEDDEYFDEEDIDNYEPV